MGFLTAMTEWIKKPLVIIQGNASIHTAKILKPVWKCWQKKDYDSIFYPLILLN